MNEQMDLFTNLLSVSSISSTVLGTGNATINETGKNSIPAHVELECKF